MNEMAGATMAECQEAQEIKRTFAAQRDTAIALRRSTAEMRITKLKRLEAAVIETTMRSAARLPTISTNPRPRLIFATFFP
jgi:hypothetical protein